METWIVWGIVGLALLALEMATGTFYILWFGIAAVLLSLITLTLNISIEVQVFLFSVLSLASLFIWKKYYKGSDKNLVVGQSQGEGVGRTGILIESTSPTKLGIVRFTEGFMGSKEWTVISDETIDIGQSVKVLSVQGNSLKVVKLNQF